MNLREEYLSFVQEFRARGEEIAGAGGEAEADDSFEGFVGRLLGNAEGVGLPEGYVPGSTFWMVKDGRVIGTVNIRHRLNEALRDFGGHIGYSIRPSQRRKGHGTRMLAMALREARRLGIRRALVTCDSENVASARVIVKNGGIFESESHSDRAGRVTRRYWIEL